MPIKSSKTFLKLAQKVPGSRNLVNAHIEKSDHNLEFSYFLFTQHRFLDWTIVGLYYAIYHASLALLAHRSIYTMISSSLRKRSSSTPG